MCATSATFDYIRHNWPQRTTMPYKQEYDYFKQWYEWYQQAQRFDQATKQPDCEDPEKAKILEKILARLDELEKKIDAR
jgi:hypothetical protein